MKILDEINSYTEQDWMVGLSGLNIKINEAEHCIKIIEAIRGMEWRAARHLATANSCSEWMDLKKHYTHRADICKHAAKRLKEYYNHKIIELTF
jgi:hypothetical protein